MEHFYHRLKLKLQSFGVLQPMAWEQIQVYLKVEVLRTGESLVRMKHGLSFVADGALKEYEMMKLKPTHVVHFLMSGDFFYHGLYHAKRHVKAIQPSTVFSLHYEHLRLLGAIFKELYPIYELICESYDENLAQRSHFLELFYVQRIVLFQHQFSPLLPYLKKKDIAQYLSINYTYFIELWNHPSKF